MTVEDFPRILVKALLILIGIVIVARLVGGLVMR